MLLESSQSLSGLAVNAPPETDTRTPIHTQALLDALSQIRNGLQYLRIQNVHLTSDSEVEQLANVLRTRGRSLSCLSSHHMVSKKYPTNKDGFLDPLLLAMVPSIGIDSFRFHQPLYFALTGYASLTTNKDGPSLVTVTAFFKFLLHGLEFNRRNRYLLSLDGLNLGDDHAKDIAECFSMLDEKPMKMLYTLSLTLNRFGEQGHGALLGLLNRNHVIQEILVDDESWQAKFRLVAQMNTGYNRGEFMQAGVFSSKDSWVDWLHKLAHCEPKPNWETFDMNAI